MTIAPQEKPDTRPVVCQRIRQGRIDSGLSLSQVAERIGSTKSHVWDLETGRARNPSLNLLIGFADVFGVSVDYLIGRAAPSPSQPALKPDAEGLALARIANRLRLVADATPGQIAQAVFDNLEAARQTILVAKTVMQCLGASKSRLAEMQAALDALATGAA